MPGLAQERRWKFRRIIFATLGGAFALLVSVQSAVAAQEQEQDPAFTRYCATCHGVDARGVEGLGVNLVESSYVASSSSAELVQFLKVGRLPNDPASITRLPMPGFALLDAAQLAAIADYLRGLNQP
jgi:mono/diheme cytochrome c family protein